MPRDAELDRLKAAQDRAFQRKREAEDAQQSAWLRRSAARDDLHRAYEDKQRAYGGQESAWEEFQRVRSCNGPRIDSLNSTQEVAYENMKSAFERASAAHQDRDGASARVYADEGHARKAEARAAVDERRRLVQEIRDARSRHDAVKPAFQQAKAVFDRAKAAHERAKAEHERHQELLKQANAAFAAAKEAFRRQLEVVRFKREQRADDRRSMARRAGVPLRHHDDVVMSSQADGTINLYFGGNGAPDGPGHGHYAMDRHGTVTYRRDPFDPHGSQNFEDHNPSRWVPRGSEAPFVGVVDGTDYVVSFKTGGPTGDQTLIADGDYSDDPQGFDLKHNHYGSKREGGWIDKDRGHYTGPDH